MNSCSHSVYMYALTICTSGTHKLVYISIQQMLTYFRIGMKYVV